ncbi:MAG: hypothetical protein VYB24_08325, partial [Pseudomonadota bacterium]|nr:hypothetical protein [Pseudomonadota bacterium]
MKLQAKIHINGRGSWAGRVGNAHFISCPPTFGQNPIKFPSLPNHYSEASYLLLLDLGGTFFGKAILTL